MIHPTAQIGPDVQIATDVQIGAYSIIDGKTFIDKGSRISPHAVIGTHAEHKNWWNEEPGHVIIEKNCIIREFVTINASTTDVTHVGENCVLLKGSHVGHDSILEKDCTISCNALIGGHSFLMRGVNLGLGAVLHQYSVLGAYSMIGMNSTVTKKNKIHPGNIYVGTPCRLKRKNEIGLSRAGITEDELEIYYEKWQQLRLNNGY